MANTKGGNFIIYSTYLPPNNEHSYRLQELIDRLILLRRKYNNLTLVLFGDLNMSREEVKDKLSTEIEPLGFKIWYKNNKNEYTREQSVKGIIKKSYLDYMITFGIDNINFQILNKLVITDHKALSIEFLDDRKRKLDRVKELIEPYNIANHKIEEITNRLVEVFNSEIAEVKLLRLLHDNKFNYKTRNRKFTFRSNNIKGIVKIIKEMQKKGDFIGLKKLIHRHKTENWHIFLKKLQELRIKNNVKEYFLRLRFYTFINRNTDVLKNLKIINNDNIKITLNKNEINEEVIKKYKNLLGDNGYKECYYDINDKVINITKEDIIYGCKNVVKNKATSWDLIPGKCIKKALKKIEDLNPVYENLKVILNRYLIPGVIPEEITTNRLFCLNKKADEVGDINNIRPIAISSTFMKLIESAILTRLINEINEKKILCNKQIGFIRGCGTELNLLKLRQRVSDLKLEKNFFTKYLVFIDLKNAYDKVVHRRLFNKLVEQGISEDIIGSIKLLYSKAKLKISNNNVCINVNNGVLQGSLISPMLFNLYINDLIKELNENSYEILAYADDLCILCEGINQLLNVFKKIEKWSELNGIMVNKKKSGIMIIKGNEDRNEIEGYPVIKRYKYLGITIDDKMKINKHVGNIDKKIGEYFTRNYVLNKRYFSVKSIMLIFGYFHKSRLLYGLPAFVDQESWIKRIDKVMLTNIKKLLKLPIRTNNSKLKLALGLPDLNTYLVCRLLKLKEKYEYIFNEKLTMYDKKIKQILNTKDIPSSTFNKKFIVKRLKELGEKEGYKINDKFTNRLKDRIYSWYVDGDFLLLRFMCHRGCFREDIYKKCVLCKKEDNNIKHVINECEIMKELREKLKNELEELDRKTNNLNLLESIEYFYYSKNYSGKKDEKKKDNKGIREIKKFIKELYIKFGEHNKKDE